MNKNQWKLMEEVVAVIGVTINQSQMIGEEMLQLQEEVIGEVVQMMTNQDNLNEENQEEVVAEKAALNVVRKVI